MFLSTLFVLTSAFVYFEQNGAILIKGVAISHPGPKSVLIMFEKKKKKKKRKSNKNKFAWAKFFI